MKHQYQVPAFHFLVSADKKGRLPKLPISNRFAGPTQAALRVSESDKELLRLMRDLPTKAIEQFAVKNLVDEIVITNEVEGVNSTRHEVHESCSWLLYARRSAKLAMASIRRGSSMR